MEAKGTARPSLFELAPIRRRTTLNHANGVRACLLIFIVFDGLAGSQLPFCKKTKQKTASRIWIYVARKVYSIAIIFFGVWIYKLAPFICR